MKSASMLVLVALSLVACGGAARRAEEEGGPGVYRGALAIAPDPVRFQATRVGCVRSAVLELRNTGEAPIRVDRVTALRTRDLKLSLAMPLVLRPGGSRAVELVFAPTQPGEWSGMVRFRTDENGGSLAPVSVVAAALAPPSAADPESLDLVFVLDISTTMDEIAPLRAAIAEFFDSVAARGLDVRFGLTTFENDVIVHRRGAFLERKAFFEELDSQLVEGSWVPDPDSPRQALNFELQENVLDALYRSATYFPFRPEARRAFFLMTDDTFLEPPAVFSDGTRARHSYAEVAEALREKDVRLFSAHASEKGRGLSSSYGDQPSLVTGSGGRWIELSAVSADSLNGILEDLLESATCR